MSTLKVEKIQHPNSASVALTLDTSGYLALQAGSASTPAIQGPSDPNTGIFFPAADTIAFAEGGTEVLRIDSSGRVGIGTTSPSTRLHVQDTSGNAQFRITGTGGYTELYSDGNFYIQPNGSTKMVVQSGGNVGIGTTSPSQTLTTVGNIKIAGAQASNIAKLCLTRTDQSWSINNETDLRFYRGTGDTDSPGSMTVVFTNGGNVGIGTSSPAVKLDVNGDIFASGGDIYTGANRMLSSDSTIRPLIFGIGAGEKARIDSSGRLLVGTTSAYVNALLNLERASTASGAVVANIRNTSATSTTKDTNTILRVSANGSGADVVINCTDGVSYNYNFGGNNGGAYVMATTNGVRLSNGGTSWASDSDERVKDIIEPIENGLDKISTLRAVIGKYKTDDEDKRRSFLIAQDVQAVLPEAVYDEQGTLMLAYTDTIPLLVAALKESKERLEQLESKVTALESV